MKKKISIFVGFTLLILLLLPTIIVNDNNTNKKEIKEDFMLKTSSLKEFYSYSMNHTANYDWIEINETGTLMKKISDEDDEFQSINTQAEDG